MTLSLPDPRAPSIIAGIALGFVSTAYVFSCHAVNQMFTFPDPVTGPLNFGSGPYPLTAGLFVAGGLIICALLLEYFDDSEVQDHTLPLTAAFAALLALAGIVLTIYLAPGNPANVLYPWHQTPLILVALGGMIFLGGVAWKGILSMISSP